jgi:hypothetical protein
MAKKSSVPSPLLPIEPAVRGEELIGRRAIETRSIIIQVLRQMYPSEQGAFIDRVRVALDSIEERLRIEPL